VDTFDGPVDLLRLNPGDNQGVRYLLVAALLELGRNEDAGKLLDEHDDDIQALWPYARVIWQFRTEGGTARTRAALDDAVAANPHFVEYLLDPDSGPLEQPPHFALGSREEAVYVADELSSVCEAIPGLRTGCDPRRNTGVGGRAPQRGTTRKAIVARAGADRTRTSLDSRSTTMPSSSSSRGETVVWPKSQSMRDWPGSRR
jgi:hypothetical protein